MNINEIIFGKKRFEEWFKLWILGVPSELSFWDNYMKKRGDIYFYTFYDTINPLRNFVLDNDIPKHLLGKEVNYIDVGSGPFSRCGTQSDKVKLKCTFLDPLAKAYNVMKVKYNINNEVKIKTGFVEFLDKYFSPNTFEIVHMSNSLDHSFNPIFGIYQLLNVCKIGGIVILRHSQNEALNEDYYGLHQWNLCIENNKFIIWRYKDKIDVNLLFKDYADILLYPNIDEDGWIYNKVIIKKKKNINLPKYEYYQYAFDMIYEKMLGMIMNVDNAKTTPTNKFQLMIDRINALYHDPVEYRKFKNKIDDYDCIDIYGMSILGESIYRLLEKYQNQIGYIIDRKDINFKGKKTIRIDEYKKIGKRLLIVTAWGRKSEIQMIEEIRKLSENVDYITLYNLLIMNEYSSK